MKAVILTALPVEFKEVRKFVADPTRIIHPEGNRYEKGTFKANGRIWTVGIVQTGAGDSRSALQTERAITYFDPDVVFFVGVAGGLKDVDIGDVVASTKIYGYESGKAEEEFKPRPHIGLSGFSLVEEAKAEARSEAPNWLARVKQPYNTTPRLRVGPIAVGEKVVASKESNVYKLLRKNYSDALAVEMEGYGFLEAVNARDKPLSAIVIRGISDLIDHKNDGKGQKSEDKRQQKASHHASALAFHLLANYDPKPRIPGVGKTSYKVETKFWDDLFICLGDYDLDFLEAALREVLDNRKDDLLGSIETFAALKQALIRLDDQVLAVSWVGHLIKKLQDFPNNENECEIKPEWQVWYDANAPTELEVDPKQEPSQKYLLVTLEPVVDTEPGDASATVDTVRILAELYVCGEQTRTSLLTDYPKCSIEQVWEHLSEVIPNAGEVRAVEIFLSWQHFGQPVHKWKIWTSLGKTRRKPLWRFPYNTVVRSLDRLLDPLWSELWIKDLKVRMQQLKTMQQPLDQHTCCVECFTDEIFEDELPEKLVFKLWETLPEDIDELRSLISGVIEEKVPLWLWTYETPVNGDEFKKTVDKVLKPENFTESAALGESILTHRKKIQELGFLFDNCTRIPCLPTLAVNESGRLTQPT
ncbi:phosphorylase family protein [Acaryochloris marina]|uniref:phosphorylase family protein n=1 Tax=Acaryochloris marina TaxID=155978 RepID=UPI00164F3906|nr:5'-methylthioadenosine/S-adenosylhomocysteine nucleosidase [Acaryochloris marina]